MGLTTGSTKLVIELVENAMRGKDSVSQYHTVIALNMQNAFNLTKNNLIGRRPVYTAPWLYLSTSIWEKEGTGTTWMTESRSFPGLSHKAVCWTNCLGASCIMIEKVSKGLRTDWHCRGLVVPRRSGEKSVYFEDLRFKCKVLFQIKS